MYSRAGFFQPENKEDTMQQALIDKGVLRPSGEIVKDNINLISGTHTPPFVEMLWTVTNGETVTTNRVYTPVRPIRGRTGN